MYPNGALARSDTVEEGCLIVDEPVQIDVALLIVDQTQAVLDAMSTKRE